MKMRRAPARNTRRKNCNYAYNNFSAKQRQLRSAYSSLLLPLQYAAKLKALTDKLDSKNAELAAAITENTPTPPTETPPVTPAEPA